MRQPENLPECGRPKACGGCGIPGTGRLAGLGGRAGGRVLASPGRVVTVVAGLVPVEVVIEEDDDDTTVAPAAAVAIGNDSGRPDVLAECLEAVVVVVEADASAEAG